MAMTYSVIVQCADCVVFSRIPNAHSYNILHMEGIDGELKLAGITQNEMKSDEAYSKCKEVFH